MHKKKEGGDLIEELKEVVIKKCNYILSKKIILEKEVYTIIKLFFKGYLDLDYEFSFIELISKINKIDIDEKIKKEVLGFIDNLSMNLYSGAEFSQEEYHDIIKSFKTIVLSMIKEKEKESVIRHNVKKILHLHFVKNLFIRKKSIKVKENIPEKKEFSSLREKLIHTINNEISESSSDSIKISKTEDNLSDKLDIEDKNLKQDINTEILQEDKFSLNTNNHNVESKSNNKKDKGSENIIGDNNNIIESNFLKDPELNSINNKSQSITSDSLTKNNFNQEVALESSSKSSSNNSSDTNIPNNNTFDFKSNPETSNSNNKENIDAFFSGDNQQLNNFETNKKHGDNIINEQLENNVEDSHKINDNDNIDFTHDYSTKKKFSFSQQIEDSNSLDTHDAHAHAHAHDVNKSVAFNGNNINADVEKDKDSLGNYLDKTHKQKMAHIISDIVEIEDNIEMLKNGINKLKNNKNNKVNIINDNKNNDDNQYNNMSKSDQDPNIFNPDITHSQSHSQSHSKTELDNDNANYENLIKNADLCLESIKKKSKILTKHANGSLGESFLHTSYYLKLHNLIEDLDKNLSINSDSVTEHKYNQILSLYNALTKSEKKMFYQDLKSIQNKMVKVNNQIDITI